MLKITEKDLLAMKRKLEKCKIPKTKEGYYVIDLHEFDEETIKLIAESEMFTIKEK